MTKLACGEELVVTLRSSFPRSDSPSRHVKLRSQKRAVLPLETNGSGVSWPVGVRAPYLDDVASFSSTWVEACRALKE